MSDTPNNQPADDAQSVEKLKAALQAERDAHKATKAQYLAPIRTTLGLGDDATIDSITTSLGARLGEVDAQIAERTVSLTAERDQAVAKAATLEQTWATEKVTNALSIAFDRSGAKAEHRDDFMLLTSGWFEVKDGRVITRAGVPNVVPGQSPEQTIQGFVKSMRPAYWPRSQGGGALQPSRNFPTASVDVSAFKPGGTVTAQMAAISVHGERAVVDSLRRAGMAPPAWLTRGMK